MKQSNYSEQKSSETDDIRMAKLNSLAKRAVRLNEGALKECVAVPSPRGGYIMEIREIKS